MTAALAVLRSLAFGLWSILSAMLRTEAGRLVLVALAAWTAGDLMGARGERAEHASARLEARATAAETARKTAEDLALRQTAAAEESATAAANAATVIEEMRTHASSRPCPLSPDDVARLRRLR